MRNKKKTRFPIYFKFHNIKLRLICSSEAIFSLQCTNAFNKAWDFPPSNTSVYHSHSLIGKVTIFCYIFWFFFFLTHKNTHNTTSELYRKVPRCTQNSGGDLRKNLRDFLSFWPQRSCHAYRNWDLRVWQLEPVSCLCFFKSQMSWFFDNNNKKKYWLKTTTHNATL